MSNEFNSDVRHEEICDVNWKKQEWNNKANKLNQIIFLKFEYSLLRLHWAKARVVYCIIYDFEIIILDGYITS